MPELKSLHHAGVELLVREGTSDFKAFKEVIVHKGYSHGFRDTKARFEVMPGETWLDLGANIGAFAAWAGQRGARVEAYEPEAACFELLQKNMELNRLRNVHCHKQAVVGNGAAEMTLYLGETGSEWRNSLYKFKSANIQKVPCLQFNDVLTDEITGIKMDIEGAEIDIFDSVRSWRNVEKLVFEYHFDVNNEMALFWRHINKLKEHFDFVKHAKIPPELKYYDFFPPATIVYAMRKPANDL